MTQQLVKGPKKQGPTDLRDVVRRGQGGWKDLGSPLEGQLGVDGFKPQLVRVDGMLLSMHGRTVWQPGSYTKKGDVDGDVCV